MTMKNTLLVLFSICFLFSGCASFQAKNPNRGYLILVGGKDEPPRAIEKFVELSKNGPILIITSASNEPSKWGPKTADLFRSFGAKRVELLHIADTDSANTNSTIDKIGKARGIFFIGGAQTRLMERLGGTKTEKAIQRLYLHKKGVVGGSSAGAAVQSEIMIIGSGDLAVLEKQNIRTGHGLGLLQNCIVDQHFVARQRNNRLLSLVIETGLPGIGIDESTAIIYYPDDTFEVFGQGSVLVYDPRCSRVPASDSTKLSIENVRLSVLRHHQAFDMETGKIIETHKGESL